MEIGQSPGVGATAGANLPAAATTGISSDFETFLRMLTVQMQNQDPLNPVDSSDYATQLATFSGVEQAVLTNDLLKTLTTQMNSNGLADMAAWVGKEARAAAPAYFDGNPITLAPKPVLGAQSAEIVVRDARGVEVQRFAVPTTGEPAEWAGVAPGGFPFANGQYSFEMVSTANGEVIGQEPVEVYSTVTEVRIQGGVTTMILSGGVEVASNEVTALRDPNL